MTENNTDFLYSRKNNDISTTITVKNITFGGSNIVVIAGPCAVEDEKTTMEIAGKVKALGATVLRGGAYKPRTSPYSFQGLHEGGIEILARVGKAFDMPTISEITAISQIDSFKDVDILQVGARNMQNFDLLCALGKTTKPILLKRGFANTIHELLLSAEYILKAGNPNVILCERGIRTFEPYTRSTLDISAVPILKKLSHLPVVIDPSHSSGVYWLVKPLSLAAVAAGADGLLLEVHTSPELSTCDGDQALSTSSFGELMDALHPVANAVGRSLHI